MIPVLLYHEVSDYCDEYTNLDCHCYTKNFIKHLEFFKREGFSIITLDEAILRLNSNVSLDARCIVLTFDDAFESFYDIVYPILCDMRVISHLYVPVGRINQYSMWMKDIKSYKKLMKYSQIEEVAANNVKVGSHSMTHSKLALINGENKSAEIMNSKLILENIIGLPVDDFSYPHGSYCQETIEYVQKAGYRTAVTCISEFFNNTHSKLEIPRIYITQNDTVDSLSDKILFI